MRGIASPTNQKSIRVANHPFKNNPSKHDCMQVLVRVTSGSQMICTLSAESIRLRLHYHQRWNHPQEDPRDRFHLCQMQSPFGDVGGMMIMTMLGNPLLSSLELSPSGALNHDLLDTISATHETRSKAIPRQSRNRFYASCRNALGRAWLAPILFAPLNPNLLLRPVSHHSMARRSMLLVVMAKEMTKIIRKFVGLISHKLRARMEFEITVMGLKQRVTRYPAIIFPLLYRSHVSEHPRVYIRRERCHILRI